jgi:phytoene synthase
MTVSEMPTTMSFDLARSRHYCEQVTRAQAKNFYYGLKLLPEPRRSAMFTLYAWMRLVDDIADEDDGRSIEQRLDDLESWRKQTHTVLNGALASRGAGHAAQAGRLNGSKPYDRGDYYFNAAKRPGDLWPAFADMVSRYRLPAKIFDEVIAGQRQDLEPSPFETFDALYDYCYRVAGVVGLASIYIWGFEGGEAVEQLAVERGVAFQLTNILRDLKEDAARGRVYLPQDELRVSAIEESDIRQERGGPRFLDMMDFQIRRAQHYYDKSSALEKHISAECRPTLIAMTEIYHGLLEKIVLEPERVLHERVSLSIFSKLRIGWRATRVRVS